MAVSKAIDVILGLKDQMSAGLNRANANLNKFSNKISEVNKKMIRASGWGKNFGKGLVAAGDKMQAFGRRMSTMVTLPVIGGLTLATKHFADFQDALLSVQETTDISGGALEGLGDSIHEMSKRLPLTAEELLKITAEVGQLGVRAPQDLLKVTEVMAKFGRVSGMSGEKAATTLTRILTLANEPIQDIEKLASAFVALGDTTKANEEKIAGATFAMSKAIGSAFNVSSDKLAALGATFAELGFEGMQGATSVSNGFKTIDKIIREGKSDQIREMLRLTGLSFEELKTQFKTDSFSVFEKFIEGLNLAQEQGENMGDSLTKVGLKSEKVQSKIKALANNFDKLKKNLSTTDKEYKNAIALNEEFAIKMQGLNAKFALIRNRFADFGDKIAKVVVPIIENELLPAIDKMFAYFDKNPELAKTIVKFGLLAAALGPVVYIVGTFLSGLGSVIIAVSSLSTLLGSLGIGFGAAAIIMLKFVAIAVAIGAVAYGIYKNWEPIKDFFLRFWDGPLARWMTGRTLLDWLQAAPKKIMSAWAFLKPYLIAFWDSPFMKIMKFSSGITLIMALAGKVRAAWEPLKPLLVSIWDASKAAFNSMLSAIMAGLTAIGDMIKKASNWLLFGSSAGAAASGTAAATTGGGGGGQGGGGGVAMTTPQLGADRQFASNNVQKTVTENNAKVTVDFKNMPKGTSVTPNSNGGNLDLNLGYATA